LAAYIEAARIAGKKGTPLFLTATGKTQQLTERGITQPEVYLVIRRRAGGAGIETLIGCHTFRATGITAYLKNGGKLEVAQQIRPHNRPV
jgi:site-specific recombinase XerD